MKNNLIWTELSHYSSYYITPDNINLIGFVINGTGTFQTVRQNCIHLGTAAVCVKHSKKFHSSQSVCSWNVSAGRIERSLSELLILLTRLHFISLRVRICFTSKIISGFWNFHFPLTHCLVEQKTSAIFQLFQQHSEWLK